MKPKTVFLLIFFGLLTFSAYLFIQSEQNLRIFNGEFHFLGFHFFVINGIVAALLFAVLLPSIFFSFKYHELSRHTKSIEREVRADKDARERMDLTRDLYQHGLYRAALDRLDQPETASDHILKARLLEALERPDEATPLLKQAFYEDHQVEAGYLLADNLERLEHSPLEVLGSLAQSDSKHARKAWQRLLAYYDRHALWAECLEIADRLKALGYEIPRNQWVGYHFEAIRDQRDLPLKARVDQYRQVLKSIPDFVPAHLALGDAYMTAGAVEKAFKTYENAFVNTRNPVFLDRLERYYMETDRPEDAIQVYRQLMVKWGGPLINYHLGKLYFKLEMMDESLSILEPLKEALGKIPGYLYILAELKARRERSDEALEDLKELIRNGGFVPRDLLCSNCQTPYGTWRARCDRCHQWNRINMRTDLLRVEPVALSPLYY